MKLTRIAVVMFFAFCFAAVGGEGATNSLKPLLPQPSGPYGVGRTAFDWIDSTRPADTADNAGGHAEIMVYVWYPTKATSSGVKGVLLPGAKAIDADPAVTKGLKDEVFGGAWPLVVSGDITSHTEQNESVIAAPKHLPVVLYSPGAFMSSFQSTSFIEDLVSHGYIVASLEHAYEAFAVAFPDSRVVAYSPRNIQPQFLPSAHASKSEFNARLQDWSRHRADVRAADLSFALTRLADVNSGRIPSDLKGRFDLHHVAVVGHSRGGWAAIIACRRDRHFSACVNLDGNAAGEGLDFPGTPGPTQPVLYVEVPPELPADWIVLKDQKFTAEQWIQQWHEKAFNQFEKFPAGGDFVELTQPAFSHYSFTDEVLLRAAKKGNQKDYDDAVRGLRLSEEVVRTFLDRELKHDKHAVLQDRPGVRVRHFGHAGRSKSAVHNSP